MLPYIAYMDPMGKYDMFLSSNCGLKKGKMMKHQIWCSIFRAKPFKGKFQHSRDFMAQQKNTYWMGLEYLGNNHVEKL
jgi:hypothetical protein